MSISSDQESNTFTKNTAIDTIGIYPQTNSIDLLPTSNQLSEQQIGTAGLIEEALQPVSDIDSLFLDEDFFNPYAVAETGNISRPLVDLFDQIITSSDELTGDFDAGVFTVGESGQVHIDFLFDGGKYESELALFRLDEMEDYEFGSTEFIKEAARRALSDSADGYIVISDSDEGARFSGVLGEHEIVDWNDDEHLGVKTFDMNPGDRFGFMFVPEGGIQRLENNPSLIEKKPPMFSMLPSDLSQEGGGQFADLTGGGHTFAIEDIALDNKSDQDYNDFIFQVKGATGQLDKLESLIDPDRDWRSSSLGAAHIARLELEEALGLTEEPVELRNDVWFLGEGIHPSELRIDISHNINSADTTNTDQLWSGGGLGLNLDGEGLTVGVWEAGGLIRDTHEKFDGRVTLANTGSFSNHATHVAGTIGAALGGTGLNSDEARGMSPQVNLRSYNSLNDISEMNQDASLIVASNHSYGQITGWISRRSRNTVNAGLVSNSDIWFGDYANSSEEDPNFGKYGADAQALDQLLFQNPNLLSVWSAGNDRNDRFTNANSNDSYVTFFDSDPGLSGFDWSISGWYLVPTAIAPPPPSDGNSGTGYDALSSDQVAKNTLVVGAINDIPVDPYGSGDVSMSSFSSWGPTDDGRVRPDVVANGVSLISSGALSDTDYYSSSGTSMSAPSVTGTAVLLIEHYQDLFGNTPRSATTKGLLIHTATDAGNVGPDYQFGWGVVDAARAANFLTDAASDGNRHFLEERTYQGTEQVLTVSSDGSTPLKVSTVWTDPAGQPQGDGLDERTPVLVNDLNIRVVAPDGTTHYPWTLDPSDPNQPAVQNAPNTLDNVEQVFLNTPVAGNYQIYVDHSGNNFTQDYSLFVSGASLDETPIIELLTNDSVASENGDRGTLTITRTGDTSAPLDVSYTVSGTAANGIDYEQLNGTATILPGATSTIVTVNPIDDEIAEVTESVTLTLATTPEYQLGTNINGTVTIADNDNLMPLVDLSGSYFNVINEPLDTGDSFTTEFAITNSQAGQSGPFEVDFYLSDNSTISTFDRYLGSYTVTNVGGNTSTGTLTQSLRLPAREDTFWDGNTNGTEFYIGMIVDADNDVTETNENNNDNNGWLTDYDDVSINSIILNSWSSSGSFDNFKQQISDRWEQDRELIAVEYGDGRWFGIFGEDSRPNSWSSSGNFDRFQQQISDRWDQDLNLIDVEYGDGRWFGVFSRDTGRNSWSSSGNFDQFQQQISDRWDQDYELIDVAYGDGRWFGVFSDDARPNAWSSSGNFDEFEQQISDRWDQDFDLIDVEYGDGRWFGIFGPDDGLNAWSSSGDFDEFQEQISDRWDEGYELVDIAYGDGRWFGVFQD